MKRRKQAIIAIVTLLILAMVCSCLPAGAQAADNILTLHVQTHYAGHVSKDKLLKRLNEIRKEACEEGIEGLKPGDYVPMKWSSDMEEIALIRSAEATLNFCHYRLTGDYFSQAVSGSGQTSSMEVLASPSDMMYAIELWYSEKEDLLNLTGRETGHYKALIDPEYRYIGMAAFGATAGEISCNPGTSEKQTAVTGGFRKVSLPISHSMFQDEYVDFYENYTINLLQGFSEPFSMSLHGVEVTNFMKLTSGNTDIMKISSSGEMQGLKPGKTKLKVNIDGVTFKVPVEVFAPEWVETFEGWKYGMPNAIFGPFITSAFHKIGGKWYYFDKEGLMTTGWKKVSGKWYYMNSKGVMQTGWEKIKSKWYYFGKDGAMRTGWQKVGGKWYYMDESGSMQTGWEKIKHKWYYLAGSGEMQTGWLKSGGKWYYLGSDGAMVTGWKKVSGKWYYMNSDGVMQTGWLKRSGSWYYLDAGGAMVTGKQTIDGKSYTFDSSGVWVK